MVDSEHMQEWTKLREDTCNHIRQRGHISRTKYKPLLQYLILPSFDDTWAIDFVQNEGVITAFMTIWKMTKDLEAFSSPVKRLQHPKPFIPTLQSIKLDFSDKQLRDILSRLSREDVPQDLIHHTIILDGISYELQFLHGAAWAHLDWKNVVPNEWHALRSVIAELDAMADGIDI